MTATCIRPARPSDLPSLTLLRTALWPESPAEEHAGELAVILAGKPLGVVPVTVFVAQDADGALLGFLEASLRSSDDGCDRAQPVGYVEGWYVVDQARRQGIGAALLRAAEDWARAQGCLEMASEAAIDNLLSHSVHEALGFSISSRSINFRKRL
jgi:aminoglycoside 6'-N-acetyltransferase I